MHSLISKRLERYAVLTDQQQLQAAKEVMQEIALLGLYRGGFFKQAAFHGGTALRLAYGGDRFSEDLDFCLLSPDPDFRLQQLLSPLQKEIEAWGIPTEVTPRGAVDATIQKAFLKTHSLGSLLELANPINPKQKIKVKIELDINPPKGAVYHNKLHSFPVDFYLHCHDAATMFAGKLNALLTRDYAKGRDWYDFVLYVNNGVPVNFLFLKNALSQFEIADVPDDLDRQWLVQRLTKRIQAMDVEKIKQDVLPFVLERDRLEIWSQQFFLDKLDQLV